MTRLSCVITLILLASYAIGEETRSESAQAMIDAVRHANLDYDATAGCCLGFGCGIFGIGAAYVYEGRLPVHRLAALQDKSNTYVLIYTEAYVKEIQDQRTSDAITGWIVGIIVSLGLIAITMELR